MANRPPIPVHERYSRMEAAAAHLATVAQTALEAHAAGTWDESLGERLDAATRACGAAVRAYEGARLKQPHAPVRYADVEGPVFVACKWCGEAVYSPPCGCGGMELVRSAIYPAVAE